MTRNEVTHVSEQSKSSKSEIKFKMWALILNWAMRDAINRASSAAVFSFFPKTCFVSSYRVICINENEIYYQMHKFAL